ncbi:MAG TPA: ATP-binding cassette domain-containing protein [Verrucomicrobiae bacterium]|jgi:putative ABC transport system ATP-binding protein|nr:ATP-binding cassette domain-containing protein [Verrucomicrobiae bacterium]
MNDVPDAVVLRTEHLGRRVGEQWIVNDVSLSVNRGELLGLVGVSGSGKSSLLRLLNRLDEPTSGTVFLEGQDYREIPPRTLRQRLGMVTQRPFLFPGDIASNLRFGPTQRDATLTDAEIAELLQHVGLPDFAARNVANLSGGEQQRVSLARSLANRPEIMLLDEPTSALDQQAKTGIEELVRNLVDEDRFTMVLVTHDRDQARRICDRVGLIEAGRLVQLGTPAEVLHA